MHTFPLGVLHTFGGGVGGGSGNPLIGKSPYTFAKKPLIFTDHKEQTKMTLFLQSKPLTSNTFSNQSTRFEQRRFEANLESYRVVEKRDPLIYAESECQESESSSRPGFDQPKTEDDPNDLPDSTYKM